MLRLVLLAPAISMIEFTYEDAAYTVDRFGGRRALIVFRADTGLARCVIVETDAGHTVVAGPGCRQAQADRLAASALAAWDALSESA